MGPQETKSFCAEQEIIHQDGRNVFAWIANNR